MQHSIVFIHLGPAIPEFTRHALAQARHFNACPIYLLADQSALAAFAPDAKMDISTVAVESLPISETHRRFREVWPLDPNFRDGFWIRTTERFLYLETLCRQQNLQDVFHLENDMMLYVDLGELLPVFEQNYPSLAATFDNDERCVAGFIYARTADSLAAFNSWMNNLLADPGAPRLNDMLILGRYRATGPQHIDHLPIVTRDYPKPLRSRYDDVPAEPAQYQNHFEQFNSLFDAAALGQYLGGADPKSPEGVPRSGFINESCIFDPSAYEFFWAQDTSARRVMVLRSPAGGIYRINNLHIHSKNLAKFRSEILT